MSKRWGAVVAATAVVLALLTTAADAARVPGTSGGDVLFGTNSGDRIRGFSGADFIFGKGGPDKLLGDDGDDAIFGGGGADIIDGGAGNDTLYDDDSRKGDALKGREGNDVLYSLDGKADVVNCGSGTDIAFADRRDTVRGCERVIRRSQRFGDGRVRVGSNADDLFSDSDNDEIVFGLAGSDLIETGEGDDEIFPGGGRDTVNTGDDEDLIVDDDSVGGDQISSGDDTDVIFAADGAPTQIDCSAAGESGDDDIVYMDTFDTEIDCRNRFRG